MYRGCGPCQDHGHECKAKDHLGQTRDEPWLIPTVAFRPVRNAWTGWPLLSCFQSLSLFLSVSSALPILRIEATEMESAAELPEENQKTLSMTTHLGRMDELLWLNYNAWSLFRQQDLERQEIESYRWNILHSRFHLQMKVTDEVSVGRRLVW